MYLLLILLCLHLPILLSYLCLHILPPYLHLPIPSNFPLHILLPYLSLFFPLTYTFFYSTPLTPCAPSSPLSPSVSPPYIRFPLTCVKEMQSMPLKSRFFNACIIENGRKMLL